MWYVRSYPASLDKSLDAEPWIQDEKACFSQVEVMSASDYSLTFTDMQNLQRLRYKILKISSVLSFCLDVASKLRDHCHRLDELELASTSKKLEQSIDAYIADILLHRQTVKVLMKTLQGTFDLVCMIPEYEPATC